jgi:hypothetical protein
MREKTRFRDDPLNMLAATVAVAGVLITLSFFIFRANTPSDGARMVITEPVWQRESVVLTMWDAPPTGSTGRFEILAVNGISMSDLAQSAIALKPIPDLQAAYREGNTVIYSARRTKFDPEDERGDTSQIMFVQARLQPFPWGQWIERNWLIILVTAGSMIICIGVFIMRPNETTSRAMLLWVPSLFASQVMYSLGLQIGDFAAHPINLWWFMLTASAGYILTLTALLRFAFEYTRPPERVRIMLSNRRSILFSYAVPYIFFFAFLLVQWVIDPVALHWFAKWRVATALIAGACIALSLAVAVWSYIKTRDHRTRQKIRWIVYTGGLVGVLSQLLITLPALFIRRPLASLTVASVLFFIFTLSIAYAILRHRYLEVDVIINRTLVAGVITAALALFYLAALLVVQRVFGDALDRQQGSDIVLVATTLIGVALFTPIRNTAQKIIDGIFYRDKLKSQRRIAQFSASLRNDEYAKMEKLAQDLAGVAATVARTPRAGLWLRDVASAPAESQR